MRRRQSFLKFQFCREASSLPFASRAFERLPPTFGNLLTNGHPIRDAHQSASVNFTPGLSSLSVQVTRRNRRLVTGPQCQRHVFTSLAFTFVGLITIDMEHGR